MNKVRLGIIGLGEVAQIVHLPILQSLSDRYEIRVLCDISPRLLRSMGERCGVEGLYTRTAELVGREDIDAVFVLNSDEYHSESVIAAARSGKHVLVEKPMCLTRREADEIIRARDESGVEVMVAYMRRYAPAYVQMKEELESLGRINYVRVRDIIGRNHLFVEQSRVVERYDDIPPEAGEERAARAQRLVGEAIGDAAPELGGVYRLLCGLSSHDLSAMRELIGRPKRVLSAAQWNDGRFLNAIFEYDGFYATFETGIDSQRRFDAHIEVYGENKSLKVQYDTPYVWQIPTTLHVSETEGEAHSEQIVRPTFEDAYTLELEEFHRVATGEQSPKTTPEDFREDLELFGEIIGALQKEAKIGQG